MLGERVSGVWQPLEPMGVQLGVTNHKVRVVGNEYHIGLDYCPMMEGSHLLLNSVFDLFERERIAHKSRVRFTIKLVPIRSINEAKILFDNIKSLDNYRASQSLPWQWEIV